MTQSDLSTQQWQTANWNGQKVNFDGLNRWLTLGANIGVVVGLVVLIAELRQNTEMMRAQMHSDAMSIRVSNRHAEANSGEIAKIFAKLNEASDDRILGIEEAPLEVLTEEEKVRLRTRLIGARDDLGNLFYQCQEGFLDQEFCQYRLRSQIIGLLQQWRSLDVGIVSQRPSFLKEVQRIAREEGIQPPNDDGWWDK